MLRAMTDVRPEIADALTRLERGTPTALVVALDEVSRTAAALDEVRLLAVERGYAVVSVPAAEIDQVSTRSRLVQELAGPDAPEPAAGTLLDQAAEILDARSREVPVVVVVEDLRWTDPASLQVLRTLPETLGH